MINVDKYKEIIDVKYPGMIECPPGWESIVVSVLDKILENKWKCQILQIKEKFGGLRIYFTSKDHYDQIQELVKNAEFLSENTCQWTGDPGKVRTIGGWYTVLSDVEYEKRLK